MAGKGCGRSGEEDSNSSRMGKRSLSEQESGMSYLLNAAKKAHSAITAQSDRPNDNDGSEKYTGVRWSKKKGKWRVRIKANGKDNHVGFFSDQISAAAAYDKAVLRYYPSAAVDRSVRLNFPNAINDESVSSATQDDTEKSGLSNFTRSLQQSREGVQEVSNSGSAEAGTDGTRSKLNYASAFSGSFASSPRARIFPSFSQQGGSPSGLSLPVPLPPLNLAPLIVCRQSQRTASSGARNSVQLTPLAPLTSRTSGEKSSIAHLLDDKSILDKSSPSISPLDESSVTPSNNSVTPSNHSLGGYSAISTPSTMPSPSLMLSPTTGCPTSSRSHSSSHTSSKPCPSFDTPAIFASQFAPPRLCPEPTSFLPSAISFTAHPPAILQPLMSYASFSSHGIDSQQNEIDAMRGLVKLGDGAGEGPKTRRLKCQQHRSEGAGNKVVFRLREDEMTQMPLSSILEGQHDSPFSEARWSSGRPAGSQSFGLARMSEGGRHAGKCGLDTVFEPISGAVGVGGSALARFAGARAEERGRAPSSPASRGPTPVSAAAVIRRPKPPARASPAQNAGAAGDGGVASGEGAAANPRPDGKAQSFRGVTWDKVKQMWRVRLCLAGGGREHVGYFANEEAGAVAYARALERLKQKLGALPARALERHNQERDGRIPTSASAGIASSQAEPAGT